MQCNDVRDVGTGELLVGPMIPRPAVTFIALFLTLVLGANMFADATSVEYNGQPNTLILAFLIAGILGFELYKGKRQ